MFVYCRNFDLDGLTYILNNASVYAGIQQVDSWIQNSNSKRYTTMLAGLTIHCSLVINNDNQRLLEEEKERKPWTTTVYTPEHGQFGRGM
jgi:hypothetical protein